MKKQALVNIYHFIRKSTYQDGVFTQQDFDTLRHEMDIIKQHQLPATYALKYDALMDPQYTAFIKANVDEQDEIGVWWEITEEMARKAGVRWRGTDVIDLHVKAGYSLAYLPEERKLLLDVYMYDFKEIYGEYPKTIGSWVIDSVTFEYAKERYGVIGGAVCRDQIGTDGFTLWGGYFNGAYYPSKKNEYMPAQTKLNQLDMPIFRLLGPDPIYNFESGVRKEAEGIYTLEPAWTCGQSEPWVDWIFTCLTEEVQLGYGYAQVGQENSFIWGNVGDGFEMQMRHVAKLRAQNKIRVESLRDSAKWFLKKYSLTPPSTYTASKDWNKVLNLKTTWYNSRFYRTSFLWDKGEMSIRDFYIFDEAYPSRYLNDAINHNESIFDALPILSTHYWSTEQQRASIDFIDTVTKTKLKGEDPCFYVAEDDKTWQIEWMLRDRRKLSIVCEQDKMSFKMLSNEQRDNQWAMTINTLPVLVTMEKNQLICEHEGYTYKLVLTKGSFEQQDSVVIIKPQEQQIVMVMIQNEANVDEVFFTADYLQDPKGFDSQVTAPVVVDKEKLKQVKLIKPILSHHTKVKGYDEIAYCEMENPNQQGQIRYTQDGSEPTTCSELYRQALTIKKDTVIKARVFAESRNPSDASQAKYYNTLSIKGITSSTDFDLRKAYNRKGVYDLIDGEKGSMNYVDGCWLATTDVLDVTVDLGEVKKMKAINIGFMQSKRSGPYYPEYISYSVSEDNSHFELIETKFMQAKSGDPDIEIKDAVAKCNCEARYIRIVAKPYQNTFIFADQIVIQV